MAEKPPAAGAADDEVIDLAGVSVVREGRYLLRGVDWTVRQHEDWVVLGPNGAGKTTMLQVASTYLTPSQGTVRLFGRRHGAVDVRLLRSRVGYAGMGPASLVRETLPAVEIVVTGKHASFVDSRWHDYTAADWDRARANLERLSAGALADRPFGRLSAGEQQRVLIARSLMTEPELLLLDEATTGLDLGARERMIGSLSQLAFDPDGPACVLVTHHVEEIPAGFDHIIMLAGGEVVAHGPIAETLTEAALSACFGEALRLEHRDRRYRAWSPEASGPPGH